MADILHPYFDMALDTRVMDFPDWMQPRSPWTQRDTLAAMNQGVQHKQEQQAMALRVRELALRDEATTVMNEARLKQIEEAEAEVADLPLLQEYARNPEMGIPAFQSPKSFNKLQAIDLSRARSDLGKQAAADLKELYGRLSKVSAEDRAAVTDMQKAGAPSSEVWSFLGQAEERQRAKLREEKAQAVPPTAIAKLYREADDAEAAGDFELADLSRKYARTLAEGGKGKTPADPNVIEVNALIRAAEKKFQREEIDAKQYDALLSAAIAKLRSSQTAPAAAPATPTPQSNDPLGIRP